MPLWIRQGVWGLLLAIDRTPIIRGLKEVLLDLLCWAKCLGALLKGSENCVFTSSEGNMQDLAAIIRSGVRRAL